MEKERNKDHKVAAKTKSLLRSLPSVSSLLEHETVTEWLNGFSRATVTASLQATVDTYREAILAGEHDEVVEVADLLAQAEQDLVERCTPSLRRVINATGVVLHTGLGRAPLSDAAVEALVEAASGYCNLEYDLASGERGKRTAHVVDLLTDVTGAEAATVVNNNAAATLLILQTFAAGREVLVSRGQLIEIGGSFRLPDIMRASGATLTEVGTTNRTRVADYERAINEHTAMLLRAHPSNYRIVGFTQDVGISELCELASRHRVLAVDDLGSGALVDPAYHGLPDEPSVADSIAAGADLTCFSGDKLLGGPQCGIIVGRADLIDQLNANPLMRTYRVGKLTLLALEATIRGYLDVEEALATIPTLTMLTASTKNLATRATKLAEQLSAAVPDEHFYVCSDVSVAGGGSMPGHELETVVVQWRPVEASADEMAAALREADVPVVARIRDDAICFDLRTLRDGDFDDLIAAVSASVWGEEEDEDETDGISLPVL